MQAAAPLELTVRLHPLAAAVERWTCEDEQNKVLAGARLKARSSRKGGCIGRSPSLPLRLQA